MGTKRPHCRRDWDKDLKELGDQLGFVVLRWDGYPAKRNKVLIKCPHKEHWVYPQGQLNKTSCCKVASKLRDKNPFYGKPTWNAGTVGVSKGHGIGGQMDRSSPTRPDNLYFAIVADTNGKLHYKIGRSFYEPHKRLQRSLVTILGQWQGPHWLVWLTEQTLLKKCSGSRSRPIPTLASAGGTECFGEDLDLNFILSYCDVALQAPAIG
jgi:hypothetical protein